MISRQVAAISAATLASLLAVAGCSSSAGSTTANGSSAPAASASSAAAASNSGLTDQQLLTAFKAAIAQGTAVHVKGTIVSKGETVGLDLQLNKTDGSASGTISDNGATVPVISLGGTTYIQMTDSVLKMAGNIPSSAAALIKDKWVSSKSSIGSGMTSQFSGFTSYDSFLSGITSSDNGLVGGSASAGTTTYNGQTVAIYKDSDGSVAYFAATGPAYLLQVQSSNSTNSGSLAFTWNQPTTVTAPPASQIFNAG